MMMSFLHHAAPLAGCAAGRRRRQSRAQQAERDQQAPARQQATLEPGARAEAELDPVRPRGHRHRAQQVVGLEDLRGSSVDRGHPVRVPEIGEAQQRRPGCAHFDRDAVERVRCDRRLRSGDRAQHELGIAFEPRDARGVGAAERHRVQDGARRAATRYSPITVARGSHCGISKT